MSEEEQDKLEKMIAQAIERGTRPLADQCKVIKANFDQHA